MILIVSLCAQELHEEEFVKPIVKVVSKFEEDVLVVHYKDLSSEELSRAEKIILSGTALSDFEYLDNLDKFSWLKNFSKPVLGICAGMQVIGLTFGASLKDNKEIGQNEVNFEKDFLGLIGNVKVYFLHGKTVGLPTEFFGDKFYFKHSSRPIYGVLFHPEVYNHELIEGFVKI